MRSGEAVALRIEDIDWEEGSVRVDESISDVKGHFVYGSPKTDESERTVQLLPSSVEMLRAQVGDRALDPRALVFPGREDRPMRMSNFYNRHFKLGVRRALPAKLHGLRLHDMRHTAASLRYVASGGI